MRKFEKLFIFFDKKERIISGVIFVIATNVILLFALLLMIAMMKPFWDNTISFSYFLYYLFNVQMFSKSLYNAINYKEMRLRVHKNEIGQLLSFFIMSIFLGILGVFKFELLPVSKETYAPLFLNIFFTVMIFISPVVRLITRKSTGNDDGSNETDVYDALKNMPKNKLIIINGLYLFLPLIFAVIFISRLQY